ncbi:MAG TPA: FAD-dependent oxidoreductase [Stellaceae bacterium]|nr:FAD-dependent oxidoreductase [Stellaceae bacterium]
MGKTVGVIGAGMVGITAASFLQRDGHSVFVLDPGAPGEGASFGNAGCLNGSSVVPMSMPGMIRNVPGWLLDPMGPLAIRWRYLAVIAPWLVRFIRAGAPEHVKAQARALRALLAPSIETLLPLAKAAGVADLIHRAGHLWVYRTEESFRKDTGAWHLRRDNGVVVTELDADQLRQAEPALSREFTRGILVEENGHLGNPHRMVQGLARELMRNGGEIHVARATGFVLEGGRVKAIRTDRGEFPCEAAVVAAGAWSKPLAATLGDRVPLETERGYHIMIRDPEVMPRLPVADADRKFVGTPMETGLRFAGTVELAGLVAPPDWRRARILLEQGRRLLPGLEPSYPAERLSLWMGHRPSLPDSLPCLGPSTASPDVIYAFGHGHVGMAASPMTGKLVSDLITARAPAIDIAPFSARRFS